MKFESLLKRIFRYREIDHTDGRPYLTRYFVFFRKRPQWASFNVFLHHFHSSDDDRAYYDHPWNYWGSFILSGGYWEHKPDPSNFLSTSKDGKIKKLRIGSKKWIKPFRLRFHTGETLHRISLDPAKAKRSTWTLFLVGKRVRDWGFSESGNDWTDYREYLALPTEYEPSSD